MFSVYVLELRHLHSHPSFGHPLEYLVEETKHMRQTEVESIVFSWQIVLRVSLLVLPYVELRILH